MYYFDKRKDAILDFLKDLSDLLAKHKAEISIDIDQDYAGVQGVDLRFDIYQEEISFTDSLIMEKISHNSLDIEEIAKTIKKVKAE